MLKSTHNVLRVATKQLNMLNPHQKHVKVKISRYLCGNINLFLLLLLSLSLLFVIVIVIICMHKNVHCTGIMLDATTLALWPKLCWHRRRHRERII